MFAVAQARSAPISDQLPAIYQGWKMHHPTRLSAVRFYYDWNLNLWAVLPAEACPSIAHMCSCSASWACPVLPHSPWYPDNRNFLSTDRSLVCCAKSIFVQLVFQLCFGHLTSVSEGIQIEITAKVAGFGQSMDSNLFIAGSLWAMSRANLRSSYYSIVPRDRLSLLALCLDGWARSCNCSLVQGDFGC